MLNKRVTEEMIHYLIEYFPAAASTDSVLHDTAVSLGVIRLLIDAAPASFRKTDISDWMPLHILCANKDVGEMRAMAILKLFIEKCPEAVRHADTVGCLPIHMAAELKPLEFCRLLIEAYPGSEQIANARGMLPLHCACLLNALPTVEYLSKLYPDTINHATTRGELYPRGEHYPIHLAVRSINDREDPESAFEIVKFLLNGDPNPNVKLQKWQGKSLLQCASCLEYHESNIEAAIEVINSIYVYDAHPDVIDDGGITSRIQDCHQLVQAFLNAQLVYARQAKDHRQMTTPDGNGQLPLHRALQNNARLGSIKLLVKGNPYALQSPDNKGVLPLHIACQNYDSSVVVRYLIDIDNTTLGTGTVDRNGNAVLIMHVSEQSMAQ